MMVLILMPRLLKWNLLKARETNGTLQLLSTIDVVDRVSGFDHNEEF